MSSPSRNLRHGSSSKQFSRYPSLFADVKAWFSSSVSRDKQLAWIKHGGQCSDWQESQLLFSEDVQAKDTMSLFEQMEFLWGYVTVFHASFITACIKERDMRDVAIATYLMLPPEYPLVNTRDVPGSSSTTTVPVTQRDHHNEDNAPSSVIVRHSSRRKRRLQLSKRSLQSLSSARMGNISRIASQTTRDSMGQLKVGCAPAPSSDEESRPREHRTTGPRNTHSKYQSCGSCENPVQFCHGVAEPCLDEGEMPNCDLRSLPHVNSLRQTSLPLSDFIPGQNGCTVGRKV